MYSAANTGLASAATSVQAAAKTQVGARVGRIGIGYLHRFEMGVA
jgi:hypothetical protein